jgi:hypothetical protein
MIEEIVRCAIRVAVDAARRLMAESQNAQRRSGAGFRARQALCDEAGDLRGADVDGGYDVRAVAQRSARAKFRAERNDGHADPATFSKTHLRQVSGG